MIKPELDAELDIVSSCFTMEESDKKVSTFSTFLDEEKPKVYENDPNYKIDHFMTTFEIGPQNSSLLRILKDSPPGITKSQSFTDERPVISHVAFSRSFNDSMIPTKNRQSPPKPPVQEFGFENPYFEVDFEKSDMSDPSIREMKNTKSEMSEMSGLSEKFGYFEQSPFSTQSDTGLVDQSGIEKPNMHEPVRIQFEDEGKIRRFGGRIL